MPSLWAALRVIHRDRDWWWKTLAGGVDPMAERKAEAEAKQREAEGRQREAENGFEKIGRKWWAWWSIW